MTPDFDPYDADRPLRLGCACGQHRSDAEHATATLRERSQTTDFETHASQFA